MSGTDVSQLSGVDCIFNNHIFFNFLPIFKYNKFNVGDAGITVRSRTIVMLEAGVPQKDVALRLGAGLRSVKRLWVAAKRGQSLETKARTSSPKILNRAAKIIITESLEKRRHSTRHIAKSIAQRAVPLLPQLYIDI